MNNNISMYEIQEEREEEINTHRDLVFERLNTEYGEEDEEYDYEVIAHELGKYVELSLAFLITLIIVQFIAMYNLDIQFAMIPLFLLELKTLFIYIVQLKNSKEYQNPLAVKLNSFKQILSAFGNLTFYAILVVYKNTQAFYFIFSSVPLIVSAIVRFLVKSLPGNQCHLFSIIILIIINIGLKLDNVVSMDWVAALWPIWIVLTCTTILSIGALLLVTLSICSFYYKETSISDIYSSVWIFYSTAIGSAAFAVSCYDLLNENYKRMCIWTIAFLISFIIITQFLKIHLLKWWRSFFVNHEQISIPYSNSNSGPLPLPPSQQGHMRFTTKIMKALKLPPKALVRVSSTYFMPHSAKEIPKNARTMSHEIKKDERNVHWRRFSSAPRENYISAKKSLDFSVIDKKCSICYESESNSVLMDCGHGGICFNCANVLIRDKGQCHMCRAPIVQALKIESETSKLVKVVGTLSNLDNS